MSDNFFDSNVILYALTPPSPKTDIADRLLLTGGLVSVQVLNECASVLRRKFSANWREIERACSLIRDACDVVAVSEDVHVRGLAYAERHKLQIYDAMLVAAAVLSGCKIMYSEDMHDGSVIDGLTIRNPFVGA